MDFKPVDRLPMIEWATWWDKTVQRWAGEGLPTTDRYALYEHFGMDMYRQYWVNAGTWRCPPPAHHGAGICADEKSYDAIAHLLFPRGSDLGFNWDMWGAWTREQERGDCVNWITFDGFFWFPRVLLGIERHLYAFYDQPGLMHRMNDGLAAWMLDTLDAICKIGTPDFMTFGEDMSYNHGPMLGKDLFDEFLAPYYRRVIPEFKRRGIRVIIDSDGDVSEAVDWFAEAGIEGILPLERQAGVDLGILRKKQPEMRFIGHYDKMVMPHGEAAMRAEFERLLPLMKQGGFIPSVDHQTPPGVSLENYKIYLRLLREYAVLGAC
jgi:hypothetical protein